MNLTKGEYSLLSISSQKAILIEKGIAVARIKLNQDKELRIYLLNDFFVKVTFNLCSNEILTLNLMITGIPDVFFE